MLRDPQKQFKPKEAKGIEECTLSWILKKGCALTGSKKFLEE